MMRIDCIAGLLAVDSQMQKCANRGLFTVNIQYQIVGHSGWSMNK